VNIIQRNFLRLLRCGVFGERETVEPMSEWKWQQLFKLSQIHGVTPWIADGIRLSEDDFFLQLSPTLRQQFYNDKTARSDAREQQRLTNPLLNKELQQLSEEAGSEDATFNMLQDIIAIARNMLTKGISLRMLIALGSQLRSHRHEVLYDVMAKWIERLHMKEIARLEGALLMELFHFSPEEIPFTEATTNKKTKRVIEDIFRITQQKAEEWYFTQGKSIFVRTNNSNAMLWNLKQALKYGNYYPEEAVTSFMANFAHSLTHIEE
jgi:hypothetical protein